MGLFAGCNTTPDPTDAPGNDGTQAPTDGATNAPTDAPTDAPEDPTEEPVAAMPEDAATTVYFKTGLNMNNAENGFSSSFTGVGFQVYALFERLIAWDNDAQAWNGMLAESWDVSDDGMTWTVKLKKDHKFHDGEPVTADDVVFTYNYAVKAGAFRVNLCTSIEGYDAVKAGEADAMTGVIKVDDYTVQFKLAKANALFIDTLGTTCFSILPEHLCKDIEPTNFNDSEFWHNPIGSGYFKVGETKFPDYAVLVANTDYEVQPGFEKILLRNAGEGAIQAGEAYWGMNVSQESKELLETETSDLYWYQPATTYRRYFEFNWSGKAGDTTTHPSLANAKVRKALEMLIDKESITYLFGDTATALTSEINPNHFLYNTDLPAFQRNVEEAKKILDAEGFDYSTPIRLYSDYTDQTTTDLFELVKQNFAEAGVTLEYKQDSNWELFFTAYDYDMVYNAGMNRNPIEFYNQMTIAGRSIYTADYLPDDPAVEAMVKERYDDLVAKYMATTDAAEQKTILDQLQYNAYEDTFRICLYAVENYNWYNAAHVSGFPEFARDYEEIIDLEFENWSVK